MNNISNINEIIGYNNFGYIQSFLINNININENAAISYN